MLVDKEKIKNDLTSDFYLNYIEQFPNLSEHIAEAYISGKVESETIYEILKDSDAKKKLSKVYGESVEVSLEQHRLMKRRFLKEEVNRKGLIKVDELTVKDYKDFMTDKRASDISIINIVLLGNQKLLITYSI